MDSIITGPTSIRANGLWDSEVSSVDTAILLCGIPSAMSILRIPARELTCQPLNESSGIGSPKTRPYPGDDGHPKAGSCKYRWNDGGAEMMMMYLLGLGSTSTRCEPHMNAWSARSSNTMAFVHRILRALFIHQYSAWF